MILAFTDHRTAEPETLGLPTCLDTETRDMRRVQEDLGHSQK